MTTPSYDDIRKQIGRQYRRRSIYIYHLIIAFTGLSMIWFLEIRNRPTLALIFTALWCGLIAIHTVWLMMSAARDRAIERTWQRYYGDSGFNYEKPKRTVRLTNDAELEVIEDEGDEQHYMRGR